MPLPVTTGYQSKSPGLGTSYFFLNCWSVLCIGHTHPLELDVKTPLLETTTYLEHKEINLGYTHWKLHLYRLAFIMLEGSVYRRERANFLTVSLICIVTQAIVTQPGSQCQWHSSGKNVMGVAVVHFWIECKTHSMAHDLPCHFGVFCFIFCYHFALRQGLTMYWLSSTSLCR